MKKTHLGFMKNLRNHEFVELYNNIITSVEKQQLDDETIKTAFKRVKSHKRKLNNLTNRGRSMFAIENEKLTQTRNEYLSSLRLRVQSYLLSHIAAEREAARIIHLAIKPFGREYYVPTIVRQSSYVSNLELKLKEDEGFRKAFELLRLDDLFNTLIDLTDEIRTNHEERIKENGKDRNRRAGVKKAAYKDMKILADVVNLMAVINQHDKEKRSAIEKMIDSINATLEDSSTLLKTRITKRRNRKAVETAVQELITVQREAPRLLMEVVESGTWGSSKAPPSA